MDRGARLEINIPNLISNLRLIKERVRHRPVIAVVKADAYGHGAVPVSKALIKAGAEILGVAFLSEAIELRESGINSPIIVFFDSDITEEVFRYNITPVISSLKIAKRLSSVAEKQGKQLTVHLNFDTGMGRMGIDFQKAEETIGEILSLKGLRIEGIMTHFSEADLSDKSFATVQLQRFDKLRKWFAEKGLTPLCHVANSAAVLNLPEAYMDAVRPGILLYGVSPCGNSMGKPVMTVKTEIIEIRRVRSGTPISYGRTYITRRESTIGVLPVGYADGLFRSISNRSEVLVRGKRVPVVGRVCMDLTMVDLTDLADAEVGDEVVVIGSQGNECITADELAMNAGTISYEILTSLGSKNRRTYIE